MSSKHYTGIVLSLETNTWTSFNNSSCLLCPTNTTWGIVLSLETNIWTSFNNSSCLLCPTNTTRELYYPSRQTSERHLTTRPVCYVLQTLHGELYYPSRQTPERHLTTRPVCYVLQALHGNCIVPRDKHLNVILQLVLFVMSYKHYTGIVLSLETNTWTSFNNSSCLLCSTSTTRELYCPSRQTSERHLATRPVCYVLQTLHGNYIIPRDKHLNVI